jgi:DNA-binding GntR family transcriptional regulator
MSAIEIAEDLAERITAGERGYRPGEKLPSYRELAVLYGVGATTISVVILVLKERGLVEGAPGQGVFVVEELPQ